MALFTNESRISINIGIQVASKDVLDLTCGLDVLWRAVWQLDPVIEQAVSDPEDSFVDALATHLN